jgi:phosphomethylpyrimidine synthase
MCGPKFCSMRITEEVRELAERGLADKAAEFQQAGSTLYAGGGAADDHH